jgi:hypothetical protein
MNRGADNINLGGGEVAVVSLHAGQLDILHLNGGKGRHLRCHINRPRAGRDASKVRSILADRDRILGDHAVVVTVGARLVDASSDIISPIELQSQRLWRWGTRAPGGMPEGGDVVVDRVLRRIARLSAGGCCSHATVWNDLVINCLRSG